MNAQFASLARVVCGLLTALALVCATGCSGGGDSGSTPPPPPPPTPPASTLYVSPQQFTAAAPLDGYDVVATYGVGAGTYTRMIPVLVRHPAGTSGRLPLVLWSHGGMKSTDGKFNNIDWATALVSAGYIVVHMTHLPRTDGEIAQLAIEFGMNVSAIDNEVESNIDRPRDAIAVLNDLRKIEARFPELQGRIDYDRIGVGGHSRGSYTVRTTACARINLPNIANYSFLDARPTNTPLSVQPRAYLANSPAGPNRFGLFDNGNGNHSWRECTKPDLTQSGDGDLTGEQPADRIKPFDLMPAGDKFKMYIADPNTPHETFNLNNPAQPTFENYVRSTGIAFFDAYLKELPQAKTYLTSRSLENVSSNKATLSAR
jgi:hypothetical protein